MSFAEFTRERIFEPLGMTRTSWRDDSPAHRQGPRDRVLGRDASGYRDAMPFENVHGNGGLLTTVGDLLKWNHELRVADRRRRGVRRANRSAPGSSTTAARTTTRSA